jgi:hypothetical protein
MEFYRKGDHAARLLGASVYLVIFYVAYIYHRSHVQNSTALANLTL